jgi:peptidoglycan hydrolase-like protein with peptidoglycan-binding domain
MADTTITLTFPVLRRGQGPKESVARLQELFNDFATSDDDPPPFNLSGEFGPKTEAAVKEFQTDNSLQVDGVVGKNTWKALLEYWISLAVKVNPPI